MRITESLHKRSWNFVGRDFPKHLQVAYGRYIARLLYAPKPTQPKFTLWLVDLPSNVWDLDYNGNKAVLAAFETQCRALGAQHS